MTCKDKASYGSAPPCTITLRENFKTQHYRHLEMLIDIENKTQCYRNSFAQDFATGLQSVLQTFGKLSATDIQLHSSGLQVARIRILSLLQVSFAVSFAQLSVTGMQVALQTLSKLSAAGVQFHNTLLQAFSQHYGHFKLHDTLLQALSQRYWVAQSHRMHYLYWSFSAKSPIISGSFAKNDLQLKASYGSWTHCIVYGIFSSEPALYSRQSFAEEPYKRDGILQKRLIKETIFWFFS